jgi:hypothetical protein
MPTAGIIRHPMAYGGPKPPPIDHQGVDDEFIEKASSTWYFRGGKWLTLTGADLDCVMANAPYPRDGQTQSGRSSRS